MIEQFVVFHRGGQVLWKHPSGGLDGKPVNALVEHVLLEERIGKTAYVWNDVGSSSLTMKWTLDNVRRERRKRKEGSDMKTPTRHLGGKNQARRARAADPAGSAKEEATSDRRRRKTDVRVKPTFRRHAGPQTYLCGCLQVCAEPGIRAQAAGKGANECGLILGVGLQWEG